MWRARRRRWSHTGVTVVGDLHRRSGRPCGDAVATTGLAGRDVGLVVADGAGSTANGPEAARLAVACMGQALEAYEPPGRRASAGDLLRSVDDVFNGAVTTFLQRVSETHHGSADPYATTLGLVVLHGPWLVYAGVGDSFVVVVDGQGAPHIAVAPRRPGTARNETRFVSASARPVLRVVFDPGLTAVMLSSDGLEPFLEERVVDDGKGSLPVPWRAPRETFGNIPADLRGGVSPGELSTILGGPAFQSRKGDDIGLAIAHR